MILRRGRDLADFLGLKRNILVLLLIVILVGLGERLAERFLPLYLLALGGGAFAVGLLNALNNLLSALYAYPGGYLSQRLGYKRALLLFNLLAVLGYLIVILFPYWQAAILGAFLFVSWSAISFPATMDMLATQLPKHKHTMGVSMHSLVRRIPMALGPLIGGLLIGALGETQGVRLAFLIACLLAGVAVFLQQTLIEDDRPAVIRQAGSTDKGLGRLGPALRQLLVSDVLVRFCEQIPYAFVVVWCVTIHGISPLEFGLLTTIEMVTAMLVYIPVAYLADRGTKKPYVLTTFLFFSLFPLLLLFAHGFWTMVLAFVIRGLKEFGEPARKALILELAPEGMKAVTFGLYYLIRDGVVSLAAFGGALLWDVSTARFIVEGLGFGASILPLFEALSSPATNLLVAFGFGIAGSLYFAFFGQDLGRSQPPSDQD